MLQLFKVILLIVVSLCLVNCGATMVKPINTGSKYAPLNESNRDGEVVYRLGRMDAFNKSQRESAYKQMYEQCNGKYNINNEWTDAESSSGGFSQSSASGSANKNQANVKAQSSSAYSSDTTLYQHISFSCESK